MKIQGFLTKYMKSLTYAVVEGECAFLVDPCDMEEVRKFVGNARIDFAFLTHEHYDHISGVDWVRGMGAQIIASDACDRNLRDSKLNHSKYYGAFCAAQERLKDEAIPQVMAYTTQADTTFSEEMRIFWQGHSILLKKTPGHSTGGACLLLDGKHLFSGDTIFENIDTNIDLMCGSKEQLLNSVEWILSLPNETVVYPGHYQSFTISDKKR